MPLFVSHRLYDPLLPLDYLDLLRKLDRFAQLADELQGHPPSGSNDRRPERLRRHHEDLLELAETLLPPTPDLVHERAAAKAFAEGAMLLLHYERSVLGGGEFKDTLGSRTLSAFRCDLADPSEAEAEAWIAAVRSACALDDAEWAEVEANLEPELAALAERHALVEALEALHPLEAGSPDAPAQVLALFDRLYPGHPLREGEVDLIRTGSSLFFCVPWREEELVDCAPRDEAEEQALAEFLRRLNTTQQLYFAHFPVFGFFRGEQADPSLLSELARRCGLSEERVSQTLTTMVTILKSSEVDKFIVHDAWGHQWQAHLLPFEDDLQRVGTFEQLPRLDEAVPPPAGEEGPSRLDECLRAALALLAQGEAVPPTHWDRYLRGAIGSRIGAGMSGLVAEMLADVVEYKLVSLGGPVAEQLESSSYFKALPTKLDLTLPDLRLFFRFALRGFRDFCDGDEHAEALAETLARAEGASSADAAAAVESFQERTAALLDDLFAPRFHYVATDKGVRVNLFPRLALNLLGLHSALVACYGRLERQAREYPYPLGGFRDLLVLSTAAFYQQDPRGNLWHMDEFLAHYFEPLLERLLAELSARA